MVDGRPDAVEELTQRLLIKDHGLRLELEIAAARREPRPFGAGVIQTANRIDAGRDVDLKSTFFRQVELLKTFAAHFENVDGFRALSGTHSGRGRRKVYLAGENLAWHKLKFDAFHCAVLERMPFHLLPADVPFRLDPDFPDDDGRFPAIAKLKRIRAVLPRLCLG